MSEIFVAGHTGMAGAAILRELHRRGHSTLTVPRRFVDLTNSIEVNEWFSRWKPATVILAAGTVGGIGANSRNQERFLQENVQIATTVIDAALTHGCHRLVYLGSSCVYPKNAAQPIKEESLLSGSFEATNEGYALAKTVGIKLCQYYRSQYDVAYHSVMPCNLYGPGDNYTAAGHVLPMLLRRFHDATESNSSTVTIWGSGKPLREFLHVDDLARAICDAMDMQMPPDIMNIGSGIEITIRDLAEMIADVVGYGGDIITDERHPDGVMRKMVDSSKIQNTGWRPHITLREGLQQTYAAFRAEIDAGTCRI